MITFVSLEQNGRRIFILYIYIFFFSSSFLKYFLLVLYGKKQEKNVKN